MPSLLRVRCTFLFSVCIAGTVCAAVRNYRSRLPHTIKVLCHTLSCHQGLSGQASGAQFVSSQSSNESEVQHCASTFSSVICYITDRCRVITLCVHVSSGLAVAFQILLWKEGCTYDKLGRNRTLGGQIRVLAASGECGSVTRARLGHQFLQSFFWCGVCKEGQQLVREHVNAPTVAGSLCHVSSHCLLRHCLWVPKQRCLCEINCQTRGNLFGAIDSCVPIFLVFDGFLGLCEQRVLLAAGTCTTSILLSSLASEALLASRQSSSETVVRQCVLSIGYVNWRSNRVGYLLPFFCVPRVVDSQALAAVWTILVHDLSVSQLRCRVWLRCVWCPLFFRRRCFDLSDQDTILFNLTCSSCSVAL